MRLDRAGFALSLALGALIAPVGAEAQEVLNGIPIAVLNGNQHTPVSASDGAGGVFLAWFDDRGPYGRQIYAQRMNASGVPAWVMDGIPIRQASGTNWSLAIAPDGQGGAILAWYTAPEAYDHIFAQRVDAAGNCLWGSNGMQVCSTESQQRDPKLVADGSGGAIIVWLDRRHGFKGDLYAQRVSAAGAIKWDSGGVALCLSPDEQLNQSIVASGAGSAIVAWEDYRNGSRYKVYAQLLDSSGVAQWTPDGIAVCSASGDQYEAAMVADGANGAVLAWVDRRISPGGAVRAQRLSPEGTTLWDPAGVALCDSVANVGYPRAVPDGTGGAIVAWQALIGGQFYAVAQRVSGSSEVLFDPAGKRLTNASGSENGPCIASDGLGGAVVAWTDSRWGDGDIYAQRVNAGGALKWQPEGRVVCLAASVQNTPTIAEGTPGTAIVAWSDFRSGSNYDVYAASPSPDTVVVLDVPWEPRVTGRVGSLRPNPTRAGTALDFALTTSQRVSVVVFDVSGRVVRRITSGQMFAAGTRTVLWDGTSDRGDAVPAGVYGVRVSGSDFTAMRRVAIVR